ncbi:MAG: dephospho-CoA kinase [Chloroflexi bacterium]|nr:dephospho-CoA kinase [Chloroflexota bacterium]MDA1282504.1 dephospho-CoA kinase [Chloroflexota bacterium]
MLIIGLTGGIGTGKSEVSHILRDLGAVVIESDKVAHQSYEPGTKAHGLIVNLFGEDVLDGYGFIDRKSLGKIVFADTARRLELEKIVWPATRELTLALLEKETVHRTRVVVVEVPKLFESGWDKVADVVWTVEAPQSVVSQRVERRSGMSESDTKARVAAQLTRKDRVDRADIVIENDATLEDLRNQISKLWESIP